MSQLHSKDTTNDVVWDADECPCPTCNGKGKIPSNWIPEQERIQKLNQCSKCGLQLHDVMMYVCHQVGCPTGLGGPTC